MSTLLSFLLLVCGFVISDFSIQNVFFNSSTLKPLGFKIAASWASHEGSILLWLCLLQTIGVIYIALFNSRPTQVYHIIVLALIQILFGSFIYFTSNPFDSLSFRPAQGLGLNPMLQDIALIIHPPILYLGYVCYVVPFTSACVMLLTSNLDFANLRAIKVFTNLGMLFSTLGIALGSWWAYRELGWGGFWFFDPVENISLLPWLSAIVLHHSILVMIKSGRMKNWIITLSIITFLLVVFSTFLVRSSVLTSIHSFASSPERAIYMLAIFAILAISSLVLLLVKGQNITKSDSTGLDKHKFKHKLIIWGSIFFLTALVVLLSATIYPVVYSLLYQESITISERFFINNFTIFIIPTVLLAGITQTDNIANSQSSLRGATVVATKQSIKAIKNGLLRRLMPPRNDVSLLWLNTSLVNYIRRKQLLILASSFAITFISSYQIQYGFISACAVTFSLFLIIQNCYYVLAKSNFFRTKLKANIAMILGHLGFGLLVLTITLNSLLQSEVDFIGKVGDKVTAGGFEVTLKDIRVSTAQNYYRQIAEFWIQDQQNNITILKPENRLYIIEKQLSQESNIYSYLTYDLYAVLSKIDDDVIHAKIYYKPMMSLIWISIMIIAGGLLIGLFRRSTS
ncbi:heme lyase CcmF/NrfE family subunit [Candidatus Tisiphia endosymbiont of Hybos culiciformis]|uniref:heme lyase CcmF/NrfE family subunit n=2 Tax=Candidatus Tisiphia endosymbiont of Hybos culiciformis TaxID=3139331 RepID=UPI003CCB1EAD